VNDCVQTRSPAAYSTVADTRPGPGLATSRNRMVTPPWVASESAAVVNQAGAYCSIRTQPDGLRWSLQVRSNARRSASVRTLIRWDASSTTSKRRPIARPSIRAQTVSAPVTCASISGDSSTATTRYPSAVSACVTRPAPQPSSSIDAPPPPAASWMMPGSRPGVSIAYKSTAQPSGAITPGPVPRPPALSCILVRFGLGVRTARDTKLANHNRQ
jgi:hypothetical protein